ncbi:Elongation factor Ts (EF-Ts) [Candidatus Glomeribacter gigasporarum BEG34]|uniref:Elongation factor Ts n=1 Tax=Candidatus Glomeribacter gigasporarum BEG34 TaxID=1070319 RepID=G2JAV4_9BURK|nr:Elongation factor Ts (EF-Ts) [Candidatus Glomeribacter gigasporarum BEG34]
MVEITARRVAELRAKTDAPMMECKKALTEADGNLERAEELLRVRLGHKAGKSAARITAEGVIAAHIDGNAGALVELNCETDFVAKNADFIDFANKVAEWVVKQAPANVAELLQLPFEGAPSGGTVDQMRAHFIGKIGENLAIRRFQRIQTAHRLACYLHGARIGVLVEYQGPDASIGKDVAMHIAAMKPIALSAADVPAELIERERSIARQKAAESNKPAAIIEKMVEGSVQKYLKEIALLDQPFVKNDKQTVEQMLHAAHASVHSFTLYVVGKASRNRRMILPPKWPRKPPRPDNL